MFRFPLIKISSLVVVASVMMAGAVYGQSEAQSSEASEVHKELPKYQKNYTIQKEKDNSFSTTMTGINYATPDNVYLASLTPKIDLSKVELPNSETNRYDDLNESMNSDINVEFFSTNDSNEGSFGFSGGGSCNTGGSGIRY